MDVLPSELRDAVETELIRVRSSLQAVSARQSQHKEALDALERERIHKHTVSVGEAWTQFHPTVKRPVLLIPGIGGSVLHATTSVRRAAGLDAHTHSVPHINENVNMSSVMEEEDVIVWVRSLQAEAVFSRFMLGRFDPATGTVGLLANELADSQGKWMLYSPRTRHGLYAIDTLAPHWFVKVSFESVDVHASLCR